MDFPSIFSSAQKDTLHRKWTVGIQVNTIERKVPIEKLWSDSYSFYGWSDDLLFQNHENANAIIKNNSSSLGLIIQQLIILVLQMFLIQERTVRLQVMQTN